MSGSKNPAARLIDEFTEAYNDLAPGLIRAIKENIAKGMPARLAVEAAMLSEGVEPAIRAALISRIDQAVAVGFGVRAVADPVGIRTTFLNTLWRGETMTLSDKLSAPKYKQIIIDEVAAQMSRGSSWSTLAGGLSDKNLIAGDLASHIQSLSDAATRAAPGDPIARRALQKELASAKKKVEAMARNGAPNKALQLAYRNVIKATESLNQKALDKAISQAVTEKARYNAERIARTEMARAYGVGQSLEAITDDDVVGVRFRLSSRHPEMDQCDFHCKADLFGMGPGVYPKTKQPSYPFHPHCLCLKSHVFDGEVEYSEKIKDRSATSYLRSLSDENRKAMLGAKGAQVFAQSPSKWREHLKGWAEPGYPELPPGLTRSMVERQKAPALDSV